MLEIADPVDKYIRKRGDAAGFPETRFADIVSHPEGRDFSRSRALPVTMERHKTHSLIRLEGELNVTSAAELKGLLLEGLASGGDLKVDLERAEEIDVSVMQLLWAAGREASRTGSSLVIRGSEAAVMAARDAGFERFPGEPPQV